MPVEVKCQCGQRFAAQDHLRGKQVRCPSCGGPLAIPAPARPAPAAPAEGVRVACNCGQAFMASAALRGKAARCPACGGTLHIPAAAATNDILSIDPLLTMGGNAAGLAGSPLHSPLAASPKGSASSTSQNPNTVLLIGGIIAAAAVVLIAIGAVIAVATAGRGQVAQAPAGGPGGSAVATFAPASTPASSSSSGGPPAAPPQPAGFTFPTESTTASGSNTTPGPAQPGSTANAASTSATGSSTASSSNGSAGGNSAGGGAAGGSQPNKTAFQETTTEGGAKIGFLPSGVQAWHAQENQRLKGLSRVGDSELPAAHYSWMTQLLPFLGHQKEYDRIDFSKPMTDDRNIQVGGEVIPAFLNPLDDRPKWKGYPFQGLALTHFAGMAGIEDTRNVVAGTLPRSDPRAGVFGYDEVARPEEITDGTSQTIMVVGTGSLASPWIFGGGATIRGAREPYFDKVSGLGTRNLPQPGTIAVMADGSVRFISSSVEPQVFRAMCTIHGSDSVDLEKASQPFLLESIEK